MKHSYQLKPNEDRSKYQIFEVATEQVIFEDPDKKSKQLRRYLGALRGGKGFAGWTPSFFLIKS